LVGVKKNKLGKRKIVKETHFVKAFDRGGASVGPDSIANNLKHPSLNKQRSGEIFPLTKPLQSTGYMKKHFGIRRTTVHADSNEEGITGRRK